MIRPRAATIGRVVPPDQGSLVVEVLDEQDDEPVDRSRWERLGHLVLEGCGVIGAAEMTITFVGAEAMAELNVEHMGHEGPTDVLAFPIDGPDLRTDRSVLPSGSTGVDPITPSMLGDVIVCPQVAAQNAPAHAGTYDQELSLLVTHGILHLLGHDHAEDGDAAEMQAEERRLLGRWHGEPS